MGPRLEKKPLILNEAQSLMKAQFQPQAYQPNYDLTIVDLRDEEAPQVIKSQLPQSISNIQITINPTEYQLTQSGNSSVRQVYKNHKSCRENLSAEKYRSPEKHCVPDNFINVYSHSNTKSTKMIPIDTRSGSFKYVVDYSDLQPPKNQPENSANHSPNFNQAIDELRSKRQQLQSSHIIRAKRSQKNLKIKQTF